MSSCKSSPSVHSSWSGFRSHCSVLTRGQEIWNPRFPICGWREGAPSAIFGRTLSLSRAYLSIYRLPPPHYAATTTAIRSRCVVAAASPSPPLLPSWVREHTHQPPPLCPDPRASMAHSLATAAAASSFSSAAARRQVRPAAASSFGSLLCACFLNLDARSVHLWSI